MAVVKAVTQGIGITSIFSRIASFIKTNQGSEIHGVQASEIKATFFPDFSASIILSIFVTQEKLWKDKSGFLI
jgi:hypothetical protein